MVRQLKSCTHQRDEDQADQERFDAIHLWKKSPKAILHRKQKLLEHPTKYKDKVTGYYTIRARHKVRKEVKRYPRQYAHEYKQ